MNISAEPLVRNSGFLCLALLEFGAGHCPVVGLDGFEPSTSRLSGARSNHLSYKPLLCVSDSSHLTRVCGSPVSLVWNLGFPCHRE